MERLDLNRLQIFKEVVLAGSFSKAAERLSQPKSRISRNISALERELGVQLIYRTTRQFQLTQAGTELYRRALPHLNELNEVVGQVSQSSDEIAGPLKVTVPEDIGVELMGKICRDFLLLNPKVRIDLVVANQVMDLVKESVDVAVRIAALKDSSMIQRKVGNLAISFVMSPAFANRHGNLRKLEDLASLPFLAFAALSSPKKPLRLSNGKDTRTLRLEPVFNCNNFFVLKEMAIQGSGFTLMPHFLVRDAISQGQLIPVFKDWSIEGSPVRILIPQQREVPLRVRRFVDFLVQELSLSL